MQFESQPLSPSAFSFINTDMLLNDDDSQQPGSSIDLFKYYLDMTSAQQKEQQVSSYQPSTSTIAMQDIESFQSLLNSANSSQQQQPQQQQTPLYPFADATASNPPSSTSSYSFNPTAFSIPSGSDLPFDPRYTSMPQPQEQQQQQQVGSTSSSISQQTSSNAPITRIRVKSEALEQELPAPTARRAAKKRAVSELIIEDISEEDEDQDEDEQEESEAEHAPRKSARRSTAASSSKKSAASTKASTKKASTASSVSHPHALVPVPDYIDRPSKEEYEKLSSKEKRQLRNKISARNFRHRRKAHIDTLEAEINGKDQIIDGLREEVGTLRSENQGLRADIEMLKKNWESIAAKISAPVAPVASTSASSSLSPDEEDLYGAGSLPALSPASSSASTNGDAESLFDTTASTSTAPSSSHQQQAQRRVSTRSTTAKPNVRKDISPSTGGSFWDTSASPFGGFGSGGRAMDVHTTFVPEININSPASFSSPSSLLAGKSDKDVNPSNVFAYGGNMNPALNGLSEAQVNFLRDQFVSSAAAAAAASSNHNSQQRKKNDPVRDSFFETNPFLLLRHDNLQDYRGQLYSKLAHNVAGIQATQQAQKAGNALPAALRPAFLSSPSSTSSPASAAIDSVQESERIAKHVGALATKTLFEKLSTAFWDAFAGEQPVPRSIVPAVKNSKKELDGQKIADVIGGKSKLVVVPVEKDDLASLSSQLDKLELAKK